MALLFSRCFWHALVPLSRSAAEQSLTAWRSLGDAGRAGAAASLLSLGHLVLQLHGVGAGIEEARWVRLLCGIIYRLEVVVLGRFRRRAAQLLGINSIRCSIAVLRPDSAEAGSTRCVQGVPANDRHPPLFAARR